MLAPVAELTDPSKLPRPSKFLPTCFFLLESVLLSLKIQFLVQAKRRPDCRFLLQSPEFQTFETARALFDSYASAFPEFVEDAHIRKRTHLNEEFVNLRVEILRKRRSNSVPNLATHLKDFLDSPEAALETLPEHQYIRVPRLILNNVANHEITLSEPHSRKNSPSSSQQSPSSSQGSPHTNHSPTSSGPPTPSKRTTIKNSPRNSSEKKKKTSVTQSSSVHESKSGSESCVSTTESHSKSDKVRRNHSDPSAQSALAMKKQRPFFDPKNKLLFSSSNEKPVLSGSDPSVSGRSMIIPSSSGESISTISTSPSSQSFSRRSDDLSSSKSQAESFSDSELLKLAHMHTTGVSISSPRRDSPERRRAKKQNSVEGREVPSLTMSSLKTSITALTEGAVEIIQRFSLSSVIFQNLDKDVLSLSITLFLDQHKVVILPISPTNNRSLHSRVPFDFELSKKNAQKYYPIEITGLTKKKQKVSMLSRSQISFADVKLNEKKAIVLSLFHPTKMGTALDWELTINVSQTSYLLINEQFFECFERYLVSFPKFLWIFFKNIEHDQPGFLAHFIEISKLVPVTGFFKTLIKNEVSECKEPTTLFREDSFAIRLLDAYFHAVGKPYLIAVIGPTIEHIIAADGLDIPDQLQQCVSKLISSIINSSCQLPSEIKRLLAILDHYSNLKFPGSKNVGVNSINGLFFLRFFVPCLLQPKLHGIINKDLSGSSIRLLNSLAKVLQKVANNTSFDEGNELFSMNDIIQTYTTPLMSFVEGIPSSFNQPHKLRTKYRKNFRDKDLSTNYSQLNLIIQRNLKTFQSICWLYDGPEMNKKVLFLLLDSFQLFNTLSTSVVEKD